MPNKKTIEIADLPESWKPLELPQTLGECADAAYELRAKRLDLEEQVKKMKADEERLKNHIFETFDEAHINGAKGNIASASITEELKPAVEDWDAVWAYIRENNEFDLLEKRMSRVAYRERFEQGVVIPGTQGFLYKKLSLTKISRKG